MDHLIASALGPEAGCPLAARTDERREADADPDHQRERPVPDVQQVPPHRRYRVYRISNLLSKTQAFLTIGSAIVSFGERKRFRKLL